MSCGKPHETDCAEVLAEVWLFLDHECDDARRELLEQHLDECRPCLAEYGLDEKLKKLLATKCAGEHAPAELKDRLRKSIRAIVLEQAEVTIEDGPDGHRRRGARHPHRAKRSDPARRPIGVVIAGAVATGRVARRGHGATRPQVFGRLPWFAPPFLRSRRLRARRDMVFLLHRSRSSACSRVSHVVGWMPGAATGADGRADACRR